MSSDLRTLVFEALDRSAEGGCDIEYLSQFYDFRVNPDKFIAENLIECDSSLIKWLTDEVEKYVAEARTIVKQLKSR